MSITSAIVPLKAGAKLSASAVVRDFAAKWPSQQKPESVHAEKGELVFRFGDDDVDVAIKNTPLPWSQLEGPCTSSWLWPEAASELRHHAGHLVVKALSKQKPLVQYRMLTQIVASILATCPQAIGVYWSNASLVIPSLLFQEFATKVLPLGPPVHIWVDFRVTASDKGSTGYTVGMSSLGQKELETANSPESVNRLRDRLIGLAGYLLKDGATIQNGETLEEDSKERIRAVFATSTLGNPGEVIRLEYSPGKSKKSWF